MKRSHRKGGYGYLVTAKISNNAVGLAIITDKKICSGSQLNNIREYMQVKYKNKDVIILDYRFLRRAGGWYKGITI